MCASPLEEEGDDSTEVSQRLAAFAYAAKVGEISEWVSKSLSAPFVLSQDIVCSDWFGLTLWVKHNIHKTTGCVLWACFNHCCVGDSLCGYSGALWSVHPGPPAVMASDTSRV